MSQRRGKDERGEESVKGKRHNKREEGGTEVEGGERE